MVQVQERAKREALSLQFNKNVGSKLDKEIYKTSPKLHGPICTRCGGPHLAYSENCKAKESFCNACGKEGYYAKFCRTKGRKQKRLDKM